MPKDTSLGGFVQRACLSAILTTVLVALALQPQEAASSKYRLLLERVQKGDTTVDLNELRLAYADSPEYSAGGHPDEREAMFRALQKKDYNNAIRHALKALEIEYVDIDAHHLLHIAYREMGEPEQSDFHHRIAGGLIQSILQSGDGKSTSTAFKVISTHEEYVILKVLGLTPQRQSLLKEEGHNFDVMEAVDLETKAKVTLYFNVDKPIAWWGGVFRKAN